MTGPARAPIVIPIVVMIALAGWLNPITVTAPEAGDRPAWMIKARRM
jgi:hypothetical protein